MHGSPGVNCRARMMMPSQHLQRSQLPANIFHKGTQMLPTELRGPYNELPSPPPATARRLALPDGHDHTMPCSICSAHAHGCSDYATARKQDCACSARGVVGTLPCATTQRTAQHLQHDLVHSRQQHKRGFLLALHGNCTPSLGTL